MIPIHISGTQPEVHASTIAVVPEGATTPRKLTEPLTNPKGSIVFQPRDCYFRACDPSDANGWVLSIYVFPIPKVPPCQYVDGECVCDVAIDHLNGPLACVMRLKVVRLQNENVFLGLAMNRAVLSFPSSSGWMINGPGDYTAAKKGHVLMACYPRNSIPVVGRPSLDRSITKG